MYSTFWQRKFIIVPVRNNNLAGKVWTFAKWSALFAKWEKESTLLRYWLAVKHKYGHTSWLWLIGWVLISRPFSTKVIYKNHSKVNSSPLPFYFWEKETLINNPLPFDPNCSFPFSEHQISQFALMVFWAKLFYRNNRRFFYICSELNWPVGSDLPRACSCVLGTLH